MMTWTEIPLTSSSQSFYIALYTKTYFMVITWRECDEGGWFLDIYSNNKTLLVAGIPLITGVDLLAPYTDLGFSGVLIAATDGKRYDPPTYDNLGKQSHLFFGGTT